MNTLMIAGSGVRQDSMGRYCLNDCHRASGGDPNKLPSQWLRHGSAAALVHELSQSADSHSAPVHTQNGGSTPGTYVAKELVYAYAMWISPAFHLTVIRAFDALVTRQLKPAVPAIPQTYAAALLEAGRLALENEALTVASQKQQAEITRLTPKADICEEAIRPEGGHDLRTFLTSIGPVNVPETFRWLERRKMIHRPTSKLDTGWLVTRNGMTEGRFKHVQTSKYRGAGWSHTAKNFAIWATPSGLEWVVSEYRKGTLPLRKGFEAASEVA